MSYIFDRLRAAAHAIALHPTMETEHGETCDLAHDRIAELEKQLAEKDKEIERMQNLVINFADVVQVNAFTMPAPNPYTPIFVQLANAAKNALKSEPTEGK